MQGLPVPTCKIFQMNQQTFRCFNTVIKISKGIYSLVVGHNMVKTTLKRI